MFEFLDKFEKRMEWIGAAHSILNRKGKNTEIEGLFGENELTGIIISVLLYIMEKTLEEDNECDMMHIEGFLGDLIHTYYSDRLTRQQIRQTADYIVKDILQNNGVKYTYPLKNYTENTVQDVTIRLITDKIVDGRDGRKIVYMLTNQGYDFLFRTREVDEEIQLTIEQLKLKEYIKRKKFSSAVRQSVELITLVRQKKKEIDNFILSIRQNIHNVDIDKYEALIKSTYSMLSDEYETMSDIRKMIQQAEEKIAEELGENAVFSERLEKARREVQEIHHNIGVVISEQRDLILNRHSLTDLYMDTIRRSFEFSYEKRYDFEERILAPLERCSNLLEDCLTIIRPLFLPSVKKHLSIAGLYEPQIIFKETENQDGLLVPIEEHDDHQEEERIRVISNRQVQVVRLLMQETIRTGETTLGKILAELRERDPAVYDDLKTDRCIFLTAIRLYDIGALRIKEFFEKKTRVMMTPTEEFNIEYCLAVLQNDIAELPAVQEFSVVRLEQEINDTISYEKNGIRIVESIGMSDLLFKAVI